MPDQLDITDKGGTMRLGVYPCELVPGTKAAAAYGVDMVNERHRHRFEFNNAYRGCWRRPGWLSAGSRPTAGWSRSSSCATTPGCSARSSTRSFCRARTGRIRCSAIQVVRRRTRSAGRSTPTPAGDMVKNGNGGGILQAIGAK